MNDKEQNQSKVCSFNARNSSLPLGESISKDTVQWVQTMNSSTKWIKFGSKLKASFFPDLKSTLQSGTWVSPLVLLYGGVQTWDSFWIQQKQRCCFIWITLCENFSFQMYTAGSCILRGIHVLSGAGRLLCYALLHPQGIFLWAFQTFRKSVCISRNSQNKPSVVSRNL